ncbi:MAG: PQQ-like beta-propeller repeat protein [Planctomycetia bacterium]|nr:PQQ-like beta-propeller repeat protein [Planctomycetia bacterium]
MLRYSSWIFIVLTLPTLSFAEDWPQWMGPNRDGRWNETSTIDQFPAEGAKILWRKPLAGGYAGPAVANGKVYVFDYVRGEGKLGNSPNVRAKFNGQERLLCLDAKTGEKLWEYKYACPYEISYASGPRCTPTVIDGLVYVLGAEGTLSCRDANTGSAVWSKELKKEYNTKSPTWGFCSHPLVDGEKLICGVGGEGSTLVAFDRKTGKELWKSVTAKEQGYCPPVIYTVGNTRQLIHWNAENITSLDPETGKEYWSEKLVPQYDMSIMSPRLEGNYLFAGGIGFVSACLELDTSKPAAKVLWKGDRNSSVCPVNSTPIIENGLIYGIDQPGQLRCVELKTGKRLWEAYEPTTGKKSGRPTNSGTTFLVKNGDKFFLFSETGHLIIAKLSPNGYEELSRAKILEPTNECFGRDVVWSHPAFADKCCFARNDKEIVCVSLGK